MSRVLKIIAGLVLLAACGDRGEAVSQKSNIEPAKPAGKLVLVTGATGRQGGAVARALLEKGYRVRGTTRNPASERASKMAALGVEMVKADFDSVDSLKDAMKDAYGVFSMTSFWEHGYDAEVRHGKNTVDAAVQSGIQHYVYTSVANADQDTGIPHFDSKYEVEKYIHESGLTYTVIRPVSFMENWEYHRESILSGKLQLPFSVSTPLQEISVRDIGRFVALALDNPEDWAGESLDIAGDELTPRQLQQLFSRVTGSPVEFVQTPWDVHEKNEGEEMTIMDKWFEEVGYSANINLVRSYLPGMLSLEDYLEQAGW